jgi:hypothetical protein
VVWLAKQAQPDGPDSPRNISSSWFRTLH